MAKSLFYLPLSGNGNGNGYARGPLLSLEAHLTVWSVMSPPHTHPKYPDMVEHLSQKTDL